MLCNERHGKGYLTEVIRNPHTLPTSNPSYDPTRIAMHSHDAIETLYMRNFRDSAFTRRAWYWTGRSPNSIGNLSWTLVRAVHLPFHVNRIVELMIRPPLRAQPSLCTHKRCTSVRLY